MFFFTRPNVSIYSIPKFKNSESEYYGSIGHKQVALDDRVAEKLTNNKQIINKQIINKNLQIINKYL